MKIEREVTTAAGTRLNANWLAVNEARRGDSVILIHGPRGTGKTTGALVALGWWLQLGVPVVVIRRTYAAMGKLWEHALRIYGGYGFKGTRGADWTITGPNGSRISFRPVRDQKDVEKLQGQDYAAMLVDELPLLDKATWVDLLACVRWPVSSVPLAVVCSANPYGDGDPTAAAMGTEWVYRDLIDGRDAFIPGRLTAADIEGRGIRWVAHYPTTPADNPALLEAQPGYWATLQEQLADNPRKRDAWVRGRWTAFGGSAFGHVFDRDRHVLPSPLLRGCSVPKSWRLVRALDWGEAAAWCYVLAGVSDGREPMRCGDDGRIEVCPPAGDVVSLAEIYGWDWRANCGLHLPAGEVAKKVADFEGEHCGGRRVEPGPGDLLNAREAAGEFERAGVPFQIWQKRPGSRSEGFRILLAALANSARPTAAERTSRVPGLWMTEACPTLIKYLPILPQAIGQDDIVKPLRKQADFHDHGYDTIRYLMQWIISSRLAGGVTGVLS